MGFVCNKVKAGRPKSVYQSLDFGTKELREKREQFGVTNNKQPLTCLFILWSRKKINADQFAAGCYFEELNHSLKKSSGCLQGSRNSSLARLQDGDVRVIRNKVPSICLNERTSGILADLKHVVSLVHPAACSLIERLIIANDLGTLQSLDTLGSLNMKILLKALDVMNMQMQKSAEMQSSYSNAYRA